MYDVDGMKNDPIGYDEVDLVMIANVAYTAVRQYCLNQGNDKMKPWELSLASTKKKVVRDVAVNLSYPNPATVADVHDEWFSIMTKKGWKWDEKKNVKLKTHPLLVPYDHLAPEQRTQVKLFRAVVISFT